MDDPQWCFSENSNATSQDSSRGTRKEEAYAIGVEEAEDSFVYPPPLPVLLHAIENRTPWSKVVMAWEETRGKKKKNSVTRGGEGEAMKGRRLEEVEATPKENGKTPFSLFSSQAHRIPLTFHPVYFLCWGREDDDVVQECGPPHEAAQKPLVSSSSSWCVHAQREYHDAEKTAHQLGLLPSTCSLPVLDLRAEYQEECFLPLLNAYAKGETLNVDVECNAKIKFHAALQQLVQRYSQRRSATREIQEEEEEERRAVGVGGVLQDGGGGHGATTARGSGDGVPRAQEKKEDDVSPPFFLVTGHYARMASYRTSSVTPPLSPFSSHAFSCMRVLVKPFSACWDPVNDQVHFLSRVHPSVLSSTALFPIGHLFRRKADVRHVASHFSHLLHHVVTKKTSTGICMLPRHRPEPSRTTGSGIPSHHATPSASPSYPAKKDLRIEEAARTRGGHQRKTSSLTATNGAPTPSFRFPLFLSSHMGAAVPSWNLSSSPLPALSSASSVPLVRKGTRFFDKDRQEYLHPEHFLLHSTMKALFHACRPATASIASSLSMEKDEHIDPTAEENEKDAFYLPVYAFTVGQKLQYMRRIRGDEVKRNTCLPYTAKRQTLPNDTDDRRVGEHEKGKQKEVLRKEGCPFASCPSVQHRNVVGGGRSSTKGVKNTDPQKHFLGHEREIALEDSPTDSTVPSRDSQSRSCEGALQEEERERQKKRKKKRTSGDGNRKERVECVTYYVSEKRTFSEETRREGTREEGGCRTAAVTWKGGGGESARAVENDSHSSASLPPYYAPQWLSDVVLVSGSPEHPSLMRTTTALSDVAWTIPVAVAASSSSFCGAASCSTAHLSHCTSLTAAAVPSLYPLEVISPSWDTISPYGRSGGSPDGGSGDHEESKVGPAAVPTERETGKEKKKRIGSHCLTCLCAVRHQDALQPATIYFSSSSSPGAVVKWLSPKGVRCPAPGQLVVMYVPPWTGFVARNETPLSSVPQRKHDNGGTTRVRIQHEWQESFLLADGGGSDKTAEGPSFSWPFLALCRTVSADGKSEQEEAHMADFLLSRVSGDVPLSDLMVLGSGWVQ